MGPAKVGSVQSISLTPNGQAQVTMCIDSSAAPLHEGTVARIYENSLSGIANKYVVLEPAPSEAPEIPNGGTIGEDHTYSFVSLDQVFDSLDPLTRAGLQRRHPGRGGEHPGQVRAGEQDAQVPRPRAGQHQQPDRRARPQRAGVRRAARPGGAGDAGAGVAQRSSSSDLIGQADTTTGAIAAPERSARAGAPAAARHAAPASTGHVRRTAHARSTRSIRWWPSRRSPRAGSTPFAGEPQQVHQRGDSDRRRAQRR